MRVLAAVVALASVAGCDAFGLSSPTCDDPLNDCNMLPDGGGGQSLGLYRQHDLAARPQITASSDPGANFPAVVVSAVDNYIEGPRGTSGDAWIQQHIPAGSMFTPGVPFTGCVPDPSGDGSAVCGIQLYEPVIIPLGAHVIPGDLVSVTGGTYEEFNCETCSSQFSDGRTLPEFGKPDVTRIGSSPTPEPIPVDFAALNSAGDDYVGVLVKVRQPLVAGIWSTTYGELDVDLPTPTGDNISVTNQIGKVYEDADGGMPPAAGSLVCVAGVVNYFYSTQLLARSPMDVVVVPAGTTVCP